MDIVTQPGTIDLFGINPRQLVISTDVISQQNHRIEVTLQREGATGFVDVDGAVMSSPVVNTIASFNLSKRLPFRYNLPAFSDAYGVQFANEMSYRWKAIVKEYYGIPPVEETMTMAIGHALFGGVGRIKARTYDFNADFLPNGKFLTNQPAFKLVDRDHPEWLYYPLMRTDGLNFRVNARLYFTDGTEQRVTLPNASPFHVEGEKGKVYIIPAGFTQTGIGEYETADKFILSYDIFVTQHNGTAPEQDDYTSATYHYVVDYDKQSWDKRYYLFRNQLGGMDTVCTRGKREDKQTANMKTRTTYWQQGTTAAASQHHVSNINSLSQEKASQNTGWVDYDTRMWLKGLIGSGLAWEIVGTDFVPIRITSTSTVVNKDDESLQDFEFDFEYTENEMI